MADYFLNQQLGNYRLVHLIGEGGFAKVYLGVNIYVPTLKGAIKVLRETLSDTHEQNSFRMEAEKLASLHHPNIVRLLEYGVHNNIPYMVMEYAPEGNLADRYPNGIKVPLTTVVTYVQQIASALQFAHDKKMIHRDVKPQNLLLNRDGDVLLNDFGIAVIAHNTWSQKIEDLAGTFAYTAPEQIEGKPQFASDQYSLGVIAYQWLTGKLPFQGSHVMLIEQQLLGRPAPLHIALPSISPEVENVVLKALAKDPEQRFLSVKEFANALTNAASRTQVQSPVLYADSKLAATVGGTASPQSLQLLQSTNDQHTALNFILQDFEDQARKAHKTGAWQEEIDAWNNFIEQIQKQNPEHMKFMRRERETQIEKAQYLVAIAENNLLHHSEYEKAQQLVNAGELDEAKRVLKHLWHLAPDYGDPQKLAKKIKIHVPLGRIKVQRLKAIWTSTAFLMVVVLDFFVYFYASKWPYSQLLIVITAIIASLCLIPFFFDKDENYMFKSQKQGPLNQAKAN